MNILTHYKRTSLPDRQWDWSAIDTDSHARDPFCPIGHGAFEHRAIADLLSVICKDAGGMVGMNGDCLACPAITGEACRR